MISSSSSSTSKSAAKQASRGAFIVLEGVDRCGKTTQASLLVKHLIGIGLATVAMRFPDRTTMVGDLINQYLQSKSELDDRAVHLLFSANRWEAAPTLKARHMLHFPSFLFLCRRCDTWIANRRIVFCMFLLRQTLIEEKKNIVCDRYAHSGVAFSSAKASLENDLEWCRGCDVGLPRPDAVIFLDLSQEEAEQRGGWVRTSKPSDTEYQDQFLKSQNSYIFLWHIFTIPKLLHIYTYINGDIPTSIFVYFSFSLSPQPTEWDRNEPNKSNGMIDWCCFLSVMVSTTRVIISITINLFFSIDVFFCILS